jgi:putative transcriptional regulator
MNRIQTSENKPSFNLSGCLLAASPYWLDELFQQAVCLVIHHNSERAVGVLLNKTLKVDARQLWTQFGSNPTAPSRAELCLGGPESGPIVAMHQRLDLAEFVPAEGVYFAAQVDSLKQLVADTDSDVKILVGQALWGRGQLDQQFAQGCWLPLKLNSKLAFEQSDLMWPAAIRQAGNRLIEAMVGLPEIADSADLN